MCVCLLDTFQMSVDAMLEQCLSDAQLNKTLSHVLTLKALAKSKFNLSLTTYEAGMSLMLPNSGLRPPHKDDASQHYC